MLSLNQKNTSEKKSNSGADVFANAVKRLNQSEKKLDELNKANPKKIEPSLDDREEKIWAKWKNLLKDSQLS
jgi:hypothetical protein